MNNITSSSLFKITSPIIILVWFEVIIACIAYGFGFIGNLLSLIIFYSQDKFRKISTDTLFLLMTLSNTIHLWTLTTEFLSTFSIYVYSNEFLQCRLNYFVQNVSRAMSTYLAITAILDCLIRSELPIRSRIICTCQNAIKLTLMYLIIFSILCSFWFCPLNSWNPTTVRFILVCIVPILIMILANIRVLYNIYQLRRCVEPKKQININVITTNDVMMPRRMTLFNRMLFYMMLANTCIFIVSQIPFHLYTIVRPFYKVLDTSTDLLVEAILLIWSSIYFSVGFYLYCFASSLLREKFIRIIKNIKCHRIHCQRR